MNTRRFMEIFEISLPPRVGAARQTWALWRNPFGTQLLLAVLLGLPVLSAESTTNTPASSSNPLDFQSFKIISDRNIFNKNRRPNQPQERRERSSEARSPRTETFNLAGTLIHEDGSYAFFNGSDSKYRTVLTPGRAIANFTVVEVSQNAVKLKTDDDTIDLPIGLQMRKRGDEPWQLVQQPTPSEPAEVGSSTGSGSEEDDPVLKKLMERRRQETGEPASATENADTTDPDPDVGASDQADPVLKQLMQRRKKEKE